MDLASRDVEREGLVWAVWIVRRVWGVWAVWEGAKLAHSTAAYQLQHKRIGAKKAAVVGLAHVWE